VAKYNTAYEGPQLYRLYRLLFALQIIKDFWQWTESLGGVEKSEITEDVLHQLFEIGFDAPATRALCVRFKELPFITQSAAQSCHLPEVC
jgi:hypothetical protein